MTTQRLTTHHLYEQLLLVIPTLASITEAAKSQVSGFMDLNLDVLQSTATTRRIALSHYYEQNGDMVPDPDMEIFVDFAARTATATSFQDFRGYMHVEPDDLERSAIAQRAKLNEFLGHWLGNLHDQGHLIAAREGQPA